MQELIKRRLVFVEAEQTMAEVVATMRDQNISSVLVLNRERCVAGIVTERDIVQKFTLLEKEEKLDDSVAAFMTRPVHFARLAYLEDDVRDMFFQKRLRHFPVSDGSAHEQDVMGMLTVTDMTAAYLKSSKTLRMEIKSEPLVIIAADDAARRRYKTLFEALNFQAITGSHTDGLIQQALDSGYPLVFDIDDRRLEDAKQDLAKIKQHKGIFVILSSQPSLVEPLKKVLNNELHCVALKPLDISYILLLLSRLHEDSKFSPSPLPPSA